MAIDKLSVNEKTTYADATVQNSINAALIQSGSIPVIQNKLLYELQAARWTANLREYITALMRSGECTKYDDIMDRVLQETNRGVNNTSKGASKAASDNPLAIPDAAIAECVKLIKDELEKVAHVTDDD